MLDAESRAAFLRAVIAAPNDDMPRLVYADRLDEAGDPLGEFIRLQLRMEEMKATYDPVSALPPGHAAHAEWHDLCTRERQLIAANSGAWTDGLPGELIEKSCPHCEGQAPDYETNTIECRQCDSTGTVPCYDYLEFRRGFVSDVWLPWELWKAHAKAILKVCPIENAKGAFVRLTTEADGRFDPLRNLVDSWEVRTHPDYPGVKFRQCEYNMVVQAGRMTSNRTNFQNIPRRPELSGGALEVVRYIVEQLNHPNLSGWPHRDTRRLRADLGRILAASPSYELRDLYGDNAIRNVGRREVLYLRNRRIYVVNLDHRLHDIEITRITTGRRDSIGIIMPGGRWQWWENPAAGRRP